jgi:ATP-dependent protease HslVU (ClpYQ) ATPase subunit
MFDLPDFGPKKILVDDEMVRERLAKVVKDEDLRRYIL